MDRGFEPDVNRTRNLLIWSQTRYHCATDPVVVELLMIFYIYFGVEYNVNFICTSCVSNLQDRHNKVKCLDKHPTIHACSLDAVTLTMKFPSSWRHIGISSTSCNRCQLSWSSSITYGVNPYVPKCNLF